MKITFNFMTGRWAAGFIISEKIPLSGYIEGVLYMKAVENRIISIFIGPLGVNLWLGPQPIETLS